MKGMANTPMSPAEFAERLRLVFKEADIEEEHSKADGLMCEVLESLGYGEGVEVFVNARKWYA